MTMARHEVSEGERPYTITPYHFETRLYYKRKLPTTGRRGEGAGLFVDTRRLALVLAACAYPSRQAASNATDCNGVWNHMTRARALLETRCGIMLIAGRVRRNGHQRRRRAASCAWNARGLPVFARRKPLGKEAKWELWVVPSLPVLPRAVAE